MLNGLHSGSQTSQTGLGNSLEMELLIGKSSINWWFFCPVPRSITEQKSLANVFSKSPFDDVKMRISYDRHSHVGEHV